MEKTKDSFVVPLNAGWSDVGNWGALWNIEEKDKDGNAIIGDILINDVKNSYLNSSKKLLVGLGLRNLIIVQTEDATLISDKNRSQDIKKIVNKLNLKNRKESKIHKKVIITWGCLL